MDPSRPDGLTVGFGWLVGQTLCWRAKLLLHDESVAEAYEKLRVDKDKAENEFNLLSNLTK